MALAMIDATIQEDLVPLLYESALDPRPWQSFLDGLCRRFSHISASIRLTSSRADVLPYAVTSGLSDGHREPLTLSLSTTAGIACALHLHPGRPDRAFRDDEIAYVMSLRPHLEAALALQARFRFQSGICRVFAETFTRLAVGTIILDRGGSAISCNSMADDLMAKGWFVRRNGRIHLWQFDRDHALQKIIGEATAHAGRDGAAPFAGALRIENGAGETLGLLVRPIPQDFPDSDDTPAAIIYLSGQDRAHTPVRIIQEIFNLTPAEATLAAQLAKSLSLSEIAAESGLTENTVRSYAKSVLSKAGVSRQAELVRLIVQSVAAL